MIDKMVKLFKRIEELEKAVMLLELAQHRRDVQDELDNLIKKEEKNND